MAFKQICEYQSGGEIKRKLTGPTREPEGIILELSFMRLATSSALVFPLHAQDIVSVHGRNRYSSQRRQYVQGSPRKPTLVLETFLTSPYLPFFFILIKLLASSDEVFCVRYISAATHNRLQRKYHPCSRYWFLSLIVRFRSTVYPRSLFTMLCWLFVGQTWHIG